MYECTEGSEQCNIVVAVWFFFFPVRGHVSKTTYCILLRRSVAGLAFELEVPAFLLGSMLTSMHNSCFDIYVRTDVSQFPMEGEEEKGGVPD